MAGSTANSIKRTFLVLGGSLSLGLGILGIFLPVLPTTPFLLLTSYCYVRSSKRLHRWLMGHRIFGPYIYNYVTYKAVKREAKIVSYLFLWGTLLTSMFLVPVLHVRLFLLAVGLGVSIHLHLLKTLLD
ncbi:YbaN family protein [Anaerotalea alkaliphila]|uniref:DUF454 domain-containing protein n=1 Tax=Anaerotalea alkaliphila TaxID=2662126 RepID=A0A7X5KMS2_9FIRM|nr:YbaN family protein [Anaerotalea alkaliphila]NDL67008.1 DUF454 domain-containing protein [Anaerotalea alkaliphila]